MVVQTHVALLADLYGRKVSFYYAWIWLVVVSTIPYSFAGSGGV
jgi:hypothetical protein